MMKYYSPEEISEQFNVKQATVRKWIREGKLNALKLGGLWRVSEEDLQRFIEGGQERDQDSWTAEEKARRREAEAGRAVVCHIDNDLKLKAWAEDKGLLVYIGRKNKQRGMAESKWHNPSNKGGRKKMIEDFIAHYWASQHLQDSIGELKAKVLVCYCYPEQCHGDFLAEQANKL